MAKRLTSEERKAKAPTTSRLSVDVPFDLHDEVRNATRFVQRKEDMDYALRHLVVEAINRELRRIKRRLNVETFPPRIGTLKAGRRMAKPTKKKAKKTAKA